MADVSADEFEKLVEEALGGIPRDLKRAMRSVAVDTMGLLLEVPVTAANLHGLRGGEQLIDAVHENHPTVREGMGGSGVYLAARLRQGRGN